NAGLAQSLTGQRLTSLISGGLPVITPLTFKVPRTFADNYAASRTTNFGMPDPNLRTPYHGCPAISRTESVGCRNRLSPSRSRMVEVPVKWAFSQKASRSKSVESGKGSLPV